MRFAWPEARGSRIGQRAAAPRVRRTTGCLAASFALSFTGWAGVAHAQSGFSQGDTTLVEASIPEGFDRGRNVSVTDKPHPDYDPLGYRVSSFQVFPKVTTGLGATSNPFLSADNAHPDGFAFVDPSLTVASDWSRHALNFHGDADLQRYFSDSRRNQSSWNADLSGKYEVGDIVTLDAETQVARQFESPFTGDVQSNIAVLSNYLRTYFKGRAVYEDGRVRAQFVVDHVGLDFASLDAVSGPNISQAQRSRELTRFNGQGEYALSPTVSVYTQVGYDVISYDHRLANGTANRDGHGERIIAGLNFDIAGSVRGSVGVGYTRRNYDSALYRSVDGVSAEASIEYFPSDLTTFTLKLRRYLEDSSISSNQPYFDNRMTVRVDHELLQNLLLNASFEFAKARYVGQGGDRTFYRTSGGARYMISHSLALQATASWGKQSSSETDLGQHFTETRGQIGIVFQR